MIANIILHIGMYHTGTTAMQDVLSHNPPELQKNGIYFYTSVPLTYALHSEVSPKLPEKYHQPAEAIFSRIVSAANAHNAHTLLLSHEGITYNPYYRSLTFGLGESLTQCRANADHILHRLHALTLGKNIQIVFYPRRQDHWINSNFCNAVYKNALCGITHEDIETRARDCLQYNTLISRWAHVFGKENIIIRPYERAQMPHGTLYDFCTHVLDCPVPQGGEHVSNVTPGRDIIRLHEHFNPYFDKNIVQLLTSKIESKESAKLLLCAKKRKAILQRFAEENTRLAQEYLHKDTLFIEEEDFDITYPDTATDINAKQRPRITAQVKNSLLHAHWDVADELIFHALGIPQPTQPFVPHTVMLASEKGTKEKADLHIIIPPHNVPEKIYALQMLFCDWLGLCVSVAVGNATAYHICTSDGTCRMCIDDILFGNAGDGQWRTHNALPTGVAWAHTKCGDIPVFYGTPDVFFENDILYCKSDIVGMTFFMLTRFEETLTQQRDIYLRVPASAQFAVQKNIAHLPLVDMWATWLGHLLHTVGVATFPQGRFALHLTHDVDHFEKDDSLLWLARAEHTLGHKGIFNVMGIQTHAIDGDFALELDENKKNDNAKLLQKIVFDFGHTLGFHPGIDSWINRLVWNLQYDSLSPLAEKFGQPLKVGRQHYLRYALPFTWRLWEERAMTCDMGVGFAEMAGFRCGTGMPFTVFDVLARHPLKLKEQPLLIMDATMNYRKLTLDAFFEYIVPVIQNAQRYNTPATILFHNSFFADSHDFVNLRKKLYVNLLKNFS